MNSKLTLNYKGKVFSTSKKSKLETVNVGKRSSKNITTSDFFTNSGIFIKSQINQQKLN